MKSSKGKDAEFDLNLLRVLVALADARSVTRAAELLSMSQSGFSSALARLRKQFGDVLFVRTANGMEATPRAAAMLASAREVMGQVQDGILRQPEFDPATTTTEFRLAMADVAEIVFLPRLLQRLAEVAPGASVNCQPYAPEQLPEALKSGEVDLALGFFPDLSTQAFFHQRLYTHTYACIMRRGHPLAGGALTELAYEHARHAAVSSPARSNGLFDEYLRRRGLRRRVVLTSVHHLSLPSVLENTDLIATLPIATGSRFADSGRIELVPLPFDPPTFKVQQHWHRLFQRDPRSRWLREQVATLFNDETDEWRLVEARLYGARFRRRAKA